MAPTRGVGLIFSSSFPSSKAIKFSRSNSAFTSIHDVICGSSIQRRCRSYAASESSKPHRYSKRVSKDERRAMVESYVHKYRISNAGKYPTAGTVKKQVGGSFYVIRLIVQELEYNSKMSSINKGNETLFDEVSNEERQPSIEAEEVSRSETIIDLTSSELSLGVEGDSNTEIIHVENIGTCNNLEAKEGSQASTWVEKPVIEEASNPTTKDDYSDSIGPQNLQMEQELKSRPLPESPEDTVIETVTIQSCQEAKGPKGDVMPETELDNYEREDISRKENKEEELPKKSTMWGNLKSFADGFINLWRKL